MESYKIEMNKPSICPNVELDSNWGLFIYEVTDFKCGDHFDYKRCHVYIERMKKKLKEWKKI